MSVRRFDSARVSKAVRLDNGWLRAPATLTRTGIFPYRQADGSVRRELRLPSEVFHLDAVASFEGVPVVVRHPTDVSPDGILDADTARLKTAGAVSSPRQDGDFLAAKILLTDKESVEAAEGGMTELSCGYRCDLDEKPGVWEGQPYDAVQRNIRGNHVALVEKGRAGPGARIRLDTGDAVQVVSDSEQSARPTIKPSLEHPTMKKIRIDGVEYEVTEQVAQAIERAESSRASRMDAEKTAAETLKAEKSKAEARADSAEAKAKDLQTKLDAATDPKAFTAKVAARVELETKAREILGDEVKLDEMADEAVKRAVLAKTTPDVKLDGKDAAYVDAAFDFALAGKGGGAKRPATARYDEADKKRDGARVDHAEAVDKYETAISEAWKKPLAATKA